MANTGQYLASDCLSIDTAVSVIDVNGDGVTETGIHIAHFKGRLDIKGMTAVDTVVITGNAHVSINVDCTGGTLTYAGDIKITDNASGAVTEVLGNIADIGVRLGRKIKWDPVAEHFFGDEEATAMLSRTMRRPWTM